MTQQGEYKKIYIQESDELLQQMNKSLLILEKEPQNKEALNTIFRCAHTLKSMSASMGYTTIAQLAHKMEDVLEGIRSGVIEISEAIVDLLFNSFDKLDELVSFAQQDKNIDTDIAVSLGALDSVCIKGPEIPEDKISDGISLNEFEKRTLARVKKEGYSCYYLKITLNKNCVLKSVRAFMVFRSLHSIGEVIKSIPDSHSLEEEKFQDIFNCIFVTKEKKELIKKKVLEVADIKDVFIEQVEIDVSWDKISLKTPTQILGSADSTAIEQIRRMQSVRIDINRLDKLMNLAEELAITKLRLIEVVTKIQDTELKSAIESLSRLSDDLQLEIMQARLVPVSQIFDRFPRLVRDLAKKEDKKIIFKVAGSEIELDRTVLDEISDSLIHLLRNAVDHGIELPLERKNKGKPEEGNIILSAKREKSYIYIEVRDDGKGMDTEEIKRIAVKRGLIAEDAVKLMGKEDILFLTAHPGFSTKEEVTDLSGRGVGLDVAKGKAEGLGGSILIESNPGEGTKITLRIPVTTAVVQALLVKSTGRVFAIPTSSIFEIIVISDSLIKKVEHQETILHRNKVLSITRINKLFSRAVTINGAQQDEAKQVNSSRLNIVIVEYGTTQFGIVVDVLAGLQGIVIKQLTKELKGIRGFSGATILGDGSVALVLDVATLI